MNVKLKCILELKVSVERMELKKRKKRDWNVILDDDNDHDDEEKMMKDRKEEWIKVGGRFVAVVRFSFDLTWIWNNKLRTDVNDDVEKGGIGKKLGKEMEKVTERKMRMNGNWWWSGSKWWPQLLLTSSSSIVFLHEHNFAQFLTFWEGN